MGVRLEDGGAAGDVCVGRVWGGSYLEAACIENSLLLLRYCISRRFMALTR